MAFTFTNTINPGVIIKVKDISELQTDYTTVQNGVTFSPAYNATITAASGNAKSSILTQLRAAINGIESKFNNNCNCSNCCQTCQSCQACQTQSQCSQCACNCTDCACSTDSCFKLDTRVTMVDGTFKAIQNVEIGDKVIGLNGINTVISLKRPMLGNRKFIQLEAVTNDDLFVIESHNFWIKTNKGIECFGNNNLNGYFIEKSSSLDYLGLTKTNPVDISNQEVLYATEGGWHLRKAQFIDGTPDIETYQLVVDGSHTFIANGYVVGGDIRDDDFDYTKVNWKGRE